MSEADPSAPPPEDSAAPSESVEGRTPLRPATLELELDPNERYLPRIPWHWIALAVLVLGGVYFGIRHRARLQADAMREQILAMHAEQLGPIGERYRAFRERIVAWTTEAANAGPPETWVDPRFRIAGLTFGEGLYLRVSAADARDPERLVAAAAAMQGDAITRCLGVAPASARGLFEAGAFLMPEWLDEVRAERDYLRLRVVDEQLRHHVGSDVPVLATMMRSQYFLLVLQQGENRRDAPVDVYAWDLREGRPLLRTRIQARGVLLPVRIDQMLPGVGMPRPTGTPSMTSGAANDCSIASQLRAMTGEGGAEVGAAAVSALAEANTPESGPDAGVAHGGDAGTR